MGITKQEGKKLYVLKRLLDVALALLLATAALFAIKTVKKDFKNIDQKKANDDTIISSNIDGDTPSGENIYVSEAIDNDKIYQGSLILVNNDTEYKWDEDGLKSVLKVRDDSETDCYSVLDNDVKARSVAASELNNMIKAFNKETGIDNIQVDSGYRSVSEQEAIYDGAEDQSIASKPGFSDYHTGYSIDLNIVDEEGNGLDFDGTGDYEWFEKNCYKYGFIVRFPEGKESLTGLDYRPWHFRYVGKPHAAYMNEKNLCLEEYLKEIKSYSYETKHLETKDANDNNYEIYYFATDSETALTSVAVPADYEYNVSGNNTDGFIVTVSLDKPVTAEAETSAENSSKADEE